MERQRQADSWNSLVSGPSSLLSELQVNGRPYLQKQSGSVWGKKLKIELWPSHKYVLKYRHSRTHEMEILKIHRILYCIGYLTTSFRIFLHIFPKTGPLVTSLIPFWLRQGLPTAPVLATASKASPCPQISPPLFSDEGWNS